MDNLDEIIQEETPIKKPKRKIYVISFFFACIFIIILGYLLSDSSNVKCIRIINNTYLSDDYIKGLCDIDLNDKYILLFSSFRENIAKESELINDISITPSKDNCVIIDVIEENIVGYIVEGVGNETNTKLVLKDGTLVDFDAAYIKNIALLPLFNNVSNDLRIKICEQLARVDSDVLTRISQINIVSFTYNSNMIELLSNDGYKIYCAVEDLQQLNYYFEIITRDSNPNPRCILFIEDYNKAAIVNCQTIEDYRNFSQEDVKE